MTDIERIMAKALIDALRTSEYPHLSPPYNANMPRVARACLTALSEAGYVVVPREPTNEMLSAGAAHIESETNFLDARSAWSAMVAAGRGEGT